jgi:dipeptidyl aminopeptidase/acylaminoacyl peptidase
MRLRKLATGGTFILSSAYAVPPISGILTRMSLRISVLAATLAAALPFALHAQQPFTIEQAMSAPFATGLSAAPSGELFAWVENEQGHRNLYIGRPGASPRLLKRDAGDDALSEEDVTWAPDASMLAYTYEPATDDPPSDGKPANPAHLQFPITIQVVVQPVATGAEPIYLGDGSQPVFMPDGHAVLFVRGGQIWIADLTALEECAKHKNCRQERPAARQPESTTPVAASDAPIHQLVVDRGNASSITISPDGRTLAYISRRREINQPMHSYLALFDMATDTLTFPAPSTGDDMAPSFSPDGTQIAWLRTPFKRAPEFAPDRVAAVPWSIQLLDLHSHQTKTIFTPTPDKPGSVLPHLAAGQPRVFFAGPHRLAFFSEADGWVHLYALDPSAPAVPTLLTPGEYEVEDVTMSPDRKALLYASNDELASGKVDGLDRDRRHLWRLDLSAPAPKPVAITHGEGIETPTGALVALVSDAHVPMHPAVIGSDGSITALNPGTLPSDYPGAQFVTPKQVLFESADGMHLHGQLFLPKNMGTGKHATLIFFHGGPRRQMLLGFPAMGYYSNAYTNNQFLASQGYIVLSVNYRCGVGYGLNFRQCIHGGGDGAAEYNDALAAAKYLRSRPDVDVKRIGVWGGSYGGYFTALSLARNSDLFAAGVDFHGVHDWNLEDNSTQWLRGSYAERDTMAAKALSSSPLGDISRWHSPVLFIHGDDDGNVSYAQTPILADRLRARNATLPPAQQVHIEELIFPDEIHAFLLHRDWVDAYAAETAFFAKILHPGEVTNR